MIESLSRLLVQGGAAWVLYVCSAGIAIERAQSAEEAMAASLGLERARLEMRLLFLGTVEGRVHSERAAAE